MDRREPGHVPSLHAVAPAGRPTPSPSPGGTLTIYGCGRDEAALFTALAPRYGVRFRIVADPVSEANADRAAGSRCVSVGHQAPVTATTLRALSRVGVELVSTRSIGVDHVDVEYAGRVGIAVGTVAYSADSVADYTLMLILMALRDAGPVLRRTAVHDYRLGGRGRELRDLTVGVVGTGRIGAAVLERLCGFGCRTLAHDPRRTIAARYVPLEELLRRSDVVTLHAPLTPDTHHLLDRRRLALLRSDAVVVNTGRGALVDTAALVDALEDGRLGGAALDVVEGERGVFYVDRRRAPVEDDLLLRLHRLPNVLLSPHTAYYTEHALRDTVAQTLATCVRFTEGVATCAG
jgi:D-specific alpha-keto acid dehydrogenase